MTYLQMNILVAAFYMSISDDPKGFAIPTFICRQRRNQASTTVVMQFCFPTPPRQKKNGVLLHGVGRHFYFGGVK